MRRKVKLAFIEHNSSRKATFNKRKKGLLKKASELSNLCGVPACAIIYGEHESETELWPPSPISVRRVISKFHDMSEAEQSKKMMNQENFLLQRITKTEEQLKKLRKDNKEMEMLNVMYQGLGGLQPPEWLQGMNMLDLNNLEWVIDQMLDKICERQEKVSKTEVGGSNEVMEEAEKAGPEDAST
ncbi:agamous-like MADS-box protein AGL80 [Punica granatum]|uniref:Agamous-like MADS-box protein AGL80 n=2 Tax=Punica granatum TaxID=22663 RepID=A0A218VQQ7_PUNGR|nr:agamous-like MADS-box protein AGL80 [Punica granatum]OWM62867.1 hypothetical protein CDL15_Pgr020161 [Punica granatum]